MRLLYPDYGGLLGDGGGGFGCHCSSAFGPVSIVWCPWFQASLYPILQGYQRALPGWFDRGSCDREVEFTQTNRSGCAAIGWNTTSMVTIYPFVCNEGGG